MRKPQLFCITYAGGTADFFSKIRDILAEDIEVYALEYAGHGTRKREAFYENFDAMAEDMAAIIRAQRNKEVPYMLFGYSMGTLVAFEVVKRYMEDDLPDHFFLAAHEPPHLSAARKKISALSDEEFVEEIAKFGGIDERMRKNKRFLQIFLPPMKNDYRYLEEYKWDYNYEKMMCDLTCFYSAEDTNIENIRQWEYYTNACVDFVEFMGNHFFLKGNETEISNRIKQCIYKEM